MTPIPLFTGYDPREAIGWHVFAQSVINRKELVSLIPLQGQQRDGTNAFTYERFLVPYYCGFQGWAIFADGADMLLRADLSELWALKDKDTYNAVRVVKHDYQTRHPRKYVGTEMEAHNGDYPRKNWSSLILWNCGHFRNRCLTPDFVASKAGSFLHRFEWLDDDRIGELPKEWNWLADEYGGNQLSKINHWTAGIPGFEQYKFAPMADEWHEIRAQFELDVQDRIDSAYYSGVCDGERQ